MNAISGQRQFRVSSLKFQVARPLRGALLLKYYGTLSLRNFSFLCACHLKRSAVSKAEVVNGCETLPTII